jgi:hypothetical protein
MGFNVAAFSRFNMAMQMPGGVDGVSLEEDGTSRRSPYRTSSTTAGQQQRPGRGASILVGLAGSTPRPEAYIYAPAKRSWNRYSVRTQLDKN